MLCARLFERGEFGGAFIEFRLKRLRFVIQRVDVLLVLRGKFHFLLLQLRELFFQRALALGVLCACLFERGEFGGAFIEFRLKRLRFVIQRVDVLLVLRGKFHFLLLQLRELFFQRALALVVLCACLFKRGELGGAFIEFRLKRLRFAIQRTDDLLILRSKLHFLLLQLCELFLQCAFALRAFIACGF